MSTETRRSQQAIRPAKAADKIGTSLPTLWRKVRTEPEFPRPRKLGPRTTVFIDGELDDYLDSKIVK